MTLANTKNRIMTQLPGAPEDLVELELLAATREFCKRTGVWRAVLTTATDDGVATYPLTPAAGSEVSMIDQVMVNDSPWEPVSDHGRPVGLAGSFYYYERLNGTINLYEYPDDGLLDIYVWLIPTTLAAVPDMVWTDWEEALVGGTLMNLMLMPGKPYTNLALAGAHRARFLSGVTQARRRALSSNSRADIGWSFPLATRSRSLRR